MTRFDAPAPSYSIDRSVWRAAGRVVATRFGIVLAAFVPTTVALTVTILLLDAGASVRIALRQAFVSSPVLVFVAPAASRSDTEALGSKLEALPHVAGAMLRRKEDALAALVASGVPAPTDGRNPLPDVWAVTLRGDGSFFTTEAVTVRDAISALPGVDQVRYDDAWVNTVDRVAATWARPGVAVLAAVLTAVAAAVFCIFALAGRALTPRDAALPGATFGIVGCGVVASAAIGAFAACLLVLNVVAGADAPAMKPIVAALGLNIGRYALATFAAALVLAGLGIWASHSSDRSYR